MRSVLVVDPYPLLRAGLEQLVRSEPVLSLAASLADAADAVAVHADVAVVGAPDESAVGTLAERLPVLALLDDAGHDAALRALRAGACGVLHRGAEPAAVASTLHAVVLGAIVAEAGVAEQLVSARGPVLFPQLTPREREVLEQLARGGTNGQIANALGLSTKTVRNHMASVCTKLQVLDRAQAAIAARDAGLGTEADVS